MVVKPSSFWGTWKHQRWKQNPTSPTNFDVFSSNKALTLHCETGELQRARQLFVRMPNRTVVSWNVMITGYSKWNMFPEALRMISLMHRSNVLLNETTFSIALSVCGRTQSSRNGKQVHGSVLKSGHQRFKFMGSGWQWFLSCTTTPNVVHSWTWSMIPVLSLWNKIGGLQ